MKICKKCSCTVFYVSGKCRDCVRARYAAWAKANPEKLKAKMRRSYACNPESRRASSAKWIKANPQAKRIKRQNRRARENSGVEKLTAGLTEKLFSLQNGRCPCCKQPLGSDFHMDHIVPLSKGGVNSDSNMQLLRKACNLNKSAKDPIDFMQERGFLL